MTQPAVSATARRLPGLARVLDDAYLTLHVAPMGFTLSLPLLGAAAAAVPLDTGAVAARLLIAFCFHLFAYGINDLVDLPLDRTEPQRRDDPLVRGAIAPRTLLRLALAQLPISLAVAALADLSPSAIGALLVAFAGLAAYDVWGKRCTWPVLTDAVQGIGWAALVFVGAAGPSAFAPRSVVLLVIILLYILLINGVHGPLRDLPNDFARGARTTAIAFGARARGDALELPARLLVYALVLHSAIVAGIAYLMMHAASAAQLATALLVIVTTLLLLAGYRARHVRATVGTVGALYVALSFAMIALAAGHNATAPIQAAVIALAIVPALAMFARNARPR